jgi:diadenosine tetraphosphate (Ap4A) HIT family hydrolase
MTPLLTTTGGQIVLPELLLVSREDGGHLIVNPPRKVWERSELSSDELVQWSFLIAATGRAMLDVLPQLDGGCINYWEAGNWALNDEAEPKGRKSAREHRSVHMHLLGRSRDPRHPSHRWGEAPRFPDFGDRYAWAERFEPLTEEECRNIVRRAEEILRERYAVSPGPPPASK